MADPGWGPRVSAAICAGVGLMLIKT